MKLLITGATGFVGRYVVAAALAAGHDVRAVVRAAGSSASFDSLDSESSPGGLDLARVDLRSSAGLVGALDGVDAVIHLAAAKEGDFTTQFAGTVVATENLLGAMATAGVERLVGVSTFSVYDYLALQASELLTEASPVDKHPARRDEYARTKLVQEDLYRRFGANTDDDPAGNRRVVIVRPGMIYGRDNLWHALLGAELGPRFLKIGTRATLPLVYVENCAEALVAAADRLCDEPCVVAGEIVNLVDDDLPSQRDYAERVAAVIDPPPSLTVPWPVMRTAARLLDRANGLALGGRAKLPGIVVPDRLHARFKPLRFTNSKAKRLLGWEPRYDLATAIARSVASDEDTADV